MCGRFTLGRSRPERLQASLGVGLRHPWPDLVPRYNIAPSQPVAIVRQAADGLFDVALVTWGLVPSWSEEPKTAYSTINARAETVDTKPAFRSAFRHRRCLVPADGWYEWEKRGPAKIPWYFHRKDGADFAFAGIWERWERGGGRLESCSIIVTGANRLAGTVHDRMPAVLAPEQYRAWLDPANRDLGALKTLLVPAPDDWFTAHRVGTLVNSPRNDHAALIEPADPDPAPELPA